MQTLRKATMGDAEWLFEWVNTPDSLSGKLSTSAPIPWADHRRWLAALIEDRARYLRIVEEDGVPIGQVRIEPRAEGYEIDIFTTKSARGRGVALQAVRAAASDLFETTQAREIRARVKRGNDASKKLFARAGFKQIADHGDHLLFALERPIT